MKLKSLPISPSPSLNSIILLSPFILVTTSTLRYSPLSSFLLRDRVKGSPVSPRDSFNQLALPSLFVTDTSTLLFASFIPRDLSSLLNSFIVILLPPFCTVRVDLPPLSFSLYSIKPSLLKYTPLSLSYVPPLSSTPSNTTLPLPSLSKITSLSPTW